MVKKYHGYKISKNEVSVLLSFEELIGSEIRINVQNGHVKGLCLEYMGLRSIPEVWFQKISSLTSLTSLSLSNNYSLTVLSLPESIGNLKNLKNLKMTNNQLGEIPEKFGDLENLEELDLTGNSLKTLPESFGNLKNLMSLSLTGNRLKKLPNSIGDLKNLRNLNLRNNYELEEIPKSFGDLENLEELDLTGNSLKTLPESFGNLKNLKSLSLSDNRAGNSLKTLPESFGNLKNLMSLSLSDNRIEKLPNSIGDLKNLRNLNMRNNELEEIPESFVDLENLEELNLAGNSLKTLLERFGKLKNLMKGLSLLKYLDLSRNNLQEIPLLVLDLPNLDNLILTENPINTLSSEFTQRIQSAAYRIKPAHASYLGDVITIHFKNNSSKIFKAYLTTCEYFERSLKDLYQYNLKYRRELFVIPAKLTTILTQEEFLEYVNNIDIDQLKKIFPSSKNTPLLVFLDGMLVYLDRLDIIRSFKPNILACINSLGQNVISPLLYNLFDHENNVRISVLECLAVIDGVDMNKVKELLLSTPHKLNIENIYTDFNPYMHALLAIFNRLELYKYIDKFHLTDLKKTFRCTTDEVHTVLAEIMVTTGDKSLFEQYNLVGPLLEVIERDYDDYGSMSFHSSYVR